MRARKDKHLEKVGFLITRINEINAWRNEQMKHAENSKQAEAIEAKALALREAAERGL